jgi:Zn-dependent protease
MTNLTAFLVSLAALVLGITVHEFSHALVAHRLGDTTAQRMGRLTLNPLAHLDPLGSLMILVSSLSGFGIGWGKPTPVSAWNLRPRGRIGMALVALGGPVSNFVVALVLATGLRLAPALPYAVYMVLIQVALVNLALAAFNLLPVPMLDGFHILMGAVASVKARWAYNLSYQLGRLEPHGPMILLVLVMLGSFMRPSPLTLLVVPVYSLLAKIIGLG